MTPPETRFKLTLHYDGSAFRGWQLQPGAATVQGAVESALARLTGEHRTVLGSGRTDTRRARDRPGRHGHRAHAVDRNGATLA